jgi:hypothetical protein
MSKFDYDTGHDIARQDPPFNALIMAAMRKADDDNLSYLKHCWYGVWQELEARYNAPGGVLPTDPELCDCALPIQQHHRDTCPYRVVTS